MCWFGGGFIICITWRKCCVTQPKQKKERNKKKINFAFVWDMLSSLLFPLFPTAKPSEFRGIHFASHHVRIRVSWSYENSHIPICGAHVVQVGKSPRSNTVVFAPILMHGIIVLQSNSRNRMQFPYTLYDYNNFSRIDWHLWSASLKR